MKKNIENNLVREGRINDTTGYKNIHKLKVYYQSGNATFMLRKCIKAIELNNMSMRLLIRLKEKREKNIILSINKKL